MIIGDDFDKLIGQEISLNVLFSFPFYPFLSSDFAGKKVRFFSILKLYAFILFMNESKKAVSSQTLSEAFNEIFSIKMPGLFILYLHSFGYRRKVLFIKLFFSLNNVAHI